MKVFISWSGPKSHKVALVFKNWIQNVIQIIEPYVSSEDIPKGTRWSSDVAKELQDSTFGILCVTKDNLEAPWLLFEAGALSKTIDTASVVPFLFDIKPSDLTGSPLLQFQATDFSKQELKKLIKTLNTACSTQFLTESRLDAAFEHWYPDLESELNKIKEETIVDDTENIKTDIVFSSDILEEILDLSRNNQKLLRNPDSKIFESIETLKSKIDEIASYNDNNSFIERRRLTRKFHPAMLEDLLHLSRNEKRGQMYGFLMMLSLYKDDFPWVYDMGKNVLSVLKSKASIDKKHNAIQEFDEMLEFTAHMPIMYELYGNKKEFIMFMREMPHILIKYLEKVVDEKRESDDEAFSML